jgi:DNA-binding response OmpR family regulator
MRILVVEDDAGIALGLRANLQQRGYAVDACGSLASAWAALCSEPFDLVLLDLGLADGDGGDLLLQIRRVRNSADGPLPDPQTPVLIMTARDQVADRISGLNLGADDYLVKPFDLDELEARMRALLRRAAGRAHPLLVHGELVIDPAAHTVLRAGQTIDLAPREFTLLLAAGVARAGAVAPAAGSAPLQLAGRRRQQCGRGACAPFAAQAGRGPDPDHARGRLLHTPGANAHDGHSRQASLTRRLLLWVLAALLLVWAGFAAVGWRTGVHEAGELTDGHLASTAALMLNLDLPPFVDASRETARAVIPALKNHDYQPSLSVLVRGAGGQLLARSGDAPLAPFSEQAGFADLALGTPPSFGAAFRNGMPATRGR